jgi:phospholipase C
MSTVRKQMMMQRAKRPVGRTGRRWGLLLTAVVVLSFSSGAMAQGNMNQIQHIIFLVRENRSFDHYFGAFPGADGATTATISN